MTVDADRVTDVIVDLLRRVPRIHPDTVWSTTLPGVFAMVTGAPFATLNGVWVLDDRISSSDLLGLLDEMPVAGLPYGVQARADQRDRIADVVAERGMTTGPDIPTMTLTRVPVLQPLENLVIRELPPARFGERTQVAAAGFGATQQQMAAATGIFGALPGYRIYLAEVDGRPVATAASIATADESLGIFDVTTHPDHRGHGYGKAITVHAIRDGFEAGARWAWLQSSTQALPVYESLGFQNLENWALWVSEA